jgi:hypothetical protein
METKPNLKLVPYWRWFVKGSGGEAGYKRLINWWIVLHVAIGVLLSLITTITLEDAARTVLLPFASVFVGLTFAWAVSAQDVLRSPEIRKFTEKRKGGFTEYIYTFQTAILTILVTLVLWSIAGLGVYDNFFPKTDNKTLYTIAKVILFGLSSLSIRECWHAVLGTNSLSIIQKILDDESINHDDAQNGV